jgi:hypothetical protein
MLACNVAVLSIAVLYYAYRDGYAVKARQRTALNERVAYMLWAAAQRAAV